MKKPVRIEMRRTLASKEIPNGTKGWLEKSQKEVHGLHLARFDTGYCAFVYLSEVREI